MKFTLYSFMLLILFSFTACTNQKVPNYYSNLNSSKKFSIIRNNQSSREIKINDIEFDISNVNKTIKTLENIKNKNKSKENFVTDLNNFIMIILDNLNFNQEITFNYDQKTKDNNLLFTKRSESGGENPKTLLLTTTYFTSTNEFNPINISILFEILRLFENFNKQYNLSVLFVNNSINLNNTVNYYTDSLLYLNPISIIDIQFEDSVNDTNLLKFNENSNLSNFLKNTIEYNSFNFIKTTEISNKNNFINLINSNIDFVKIVSGTSTNEINKCANFLVNIIADILNKPKIPAISVYDPVIKLTLDLENYDTVNQVLYKANNSDYMELTDNLILDFKDSINITIKVTDLFGNESEEIKTKFFNTSVSN